MKTIDRMTDTELLKLIGGLSDPDKMPSLSWSIPAQNCKVGAILAQIKGTVCFDCYALKGAYCFPCVRTALNRRFGILQSVLADDIAGQRFVAAFSTLLERKRIRTEKRLQRGQHVAQDGRVFRFHDSGDIQSTKHLALLVGIAENCPQIAFWLPTKEAAFVRQFLTEYGEFPPNFTVRLSAGKIDAGPPGGGLVTSTVHFEKAPRGFECGAPSRGGHCGPCRACWNSETPNVSYHLH